MHVFAKILCVLALAMASALTVFPLQSLVAQPLAAEQVNGVGLSRAEVVILRSVAREDAYRQIPDSFPDVKSHMSWLREEHAKLSEDGKDLSGIGRHGIREMMREAQQPLIDAQIYVIEQIVTELPQVYAAVSEASGIDLIMPPNSVLFAAQGLSTRDIPVLDDQIVAELNRRLPAVRVVPPEDFQPSQTALDLHLRIARLLNQIDEQKAKEEQL